MWLLLIWTYFHPRFFYTEGTYKYPSFEVNVATYQGDFYYKTTGENMANMFQRNCFSANRETCLILKEEISTLGEGFVNWIKYNKFDECMVIKMVDAECNVTYNYGFPIQCDEENICRYREEHRIVLKSFTSPLFSIINRALEYFVEIIPFEDYEKVMFWFQDDIKLTQEIGRSKQLKLYQNRYTCIKENGEVGIEENAICIRKRTIANGLNFGNHVFRNKVVIEYLANNVKNFSRLPIEVSRRLNLSNFQGTSFHDDLGRKTNNVESVLYVLPSSLNVTQELIPWMIDFPKAICGALGLRKLDNNEKEALPKENPHLKCFLDEKGQPITNSLSEVWAFSPNVAESWGHAEIKQEYFQYASKQRDILFSTNHYNVTDDWVWISPNITMKKDSARLVNLEHINLDDILQYPNFVDFMNSPDGMVIIYYIPSKYNLTGWNYYRWGGAVLFYNPALKNTTDNTLPFKNFLLNSLEGQMFVCYYCPIPEPGKIFLTEMTRWNFIDCNGLRQRERRPQVNISVYVIDIKKIKDE